MRLEGGAVKLSRILKWYGRDFKIWLKAHGEREDILVYLRLAGREVPEAPFEFVDYDSRSRRVLGAIRGAPGRGGVPAGDGRFDAGHGNWAGSS